MKIYGVLGFATQTVKSPGVYVEEIVEHHYYGDLLRNTRRYQSGDKVNPDVNISNQISIIADPFINNNIQNMRYIEFQNARWCIESIDIEYPRLIVSIGGVYNGDSGPITNDA